MLSIVTITYNDPSGLQETLESLRHWCSRYTDMKWEHIIIDSSPEKNAQVLSTLPDTWPLLHVKTPAKGIYSAMNMGAQTAKGQYLWFLNSGDRLQEAKTLRDLLNLLYTSEIHLVWTNARLIRNGKYQYTHRPRRLNLLSNLLGSNHICHQATIYRTDFFRRVGPFKTEYSLAADYEHLWRAYLAGAVGKYFDVPLVQYTMGGQSDHFERVFGDYEAIHARLKKELPWYFNLANEVLRQFDYKRVHLIKTLSRSPLAGLLRPLWVAFKRL